jgi:excisionase family DNA binding protein
MSVIRLPGVLTVSEVAKHLKVSDDTVRRQIKAGNLKARHIGGCVRILDTELARWLQEEPDADH